VAVVVVAVLAPGAEEKAIAEVDDGGEALASDPLDRSGATINELAATAPKAATVPESTPGIIEPPRAPNIARSPTPPSLAQPLRPAKQDAMVRWRTDFEIFVIINSP
jgi:hypothetical protein